MVADSNTLDRGDGGVSTAAARIGRAAIRRDDYAELALIH